MASSYNESSIKTLSSTEHIRMRPGMYIGRLGDGAHPDDGVYVLLKETIDNSIDEFTMGAGRKIEIELGDKGARVRDYGRGIPLGKLLECVSVINTGAKYDSESFKKAVGLNGVGQKAVNALSAAYRAQAIRDGQTKIVVAMRREDDVLLVDGRDALTDFREHAAVILGCGVADGVRHVDGGSACLNSHAYHFDEEVAIGTGCVFRRELDVVDQRAGKADGFRGEVESLLTADFELVFKVQIAGGEEDMDAGAVGKLDRAGSHFNVFFFGAGEGSDARLADGLGDGGDGSEVALGSHGKAGLDDVHAQFFEGMSHGKLFLRGHAAAGRLLAVAQCGVEEVQVT